MQLDIRIPIGLLFSILGLVIGVYGLVTSGDAEMYRRSLGSNVNLWTGVACLAFGVLMLVPALLSQKRKAQGGGTGSCSCEKKPEEAPRA